MQKQHGCAALATGRDWTLYCQAFYTNLIRSQSLKNANKVGK